MENESMTKRDSGLNDSRWSVERRDEISGVDLCRPHPLIVEEVKAMEVIRRARWIHRNNMCH
jgi:hypothetical protein